MGAGTASRSALWAANRICPLAVNSDCPQTASSSLRVTAVAVPPAIRAVDRYSPGESQVEEDEAPEWDVPGGPRGWPSGVAAVTPASDARYSRTGRAPPARRCRGRTQRTPRRLRAHRGDPRGRGRPIAALLVDAGPLYAYVDSDNAHHAESLALLETHPGPLIIPTLVLTEVVYLLATRLGTDSEVRFLGDLAGGAFSVEAVAASDWLRMAELAARYRDLPLGTVDASVAATAERMGITDIATLDHRHFSVVRPRHVDAFRLLP